MVGLRRSGGLLMMEEKLKHRLIGVTVLVGLGVIFIPMLLDNSGVSEPKIEIPARPDGRFTSRIIPLERELIDIQENKPPGSLERPPEAKVEPKSEGVVPVAPIKEKVAEAMSSPQDAAWQGSQGGKETKASASERAGAAGFAIQLASFSSEEKAAALKTRLQKLGYSAFVERIRANHRQVFRVRVGPVSQAKAKELQGKLEKDVNLKGMVVRYP